MKRSFLLFLFITLASLSYAQVGIGTTTPAEELDVNGNVRISGGINYTTTVAFTSNTYTITLNGIDIQGGNIPQGTLCMFEASASSTGPSNLEVYNGSINSNPANIVKRGQILLSSGDILMGETVFVIFNGTDFQILQNAVNPNYLTDCGGVLVNTQSDNNNCGACGNVCLSGYCCDNGNCVLSCQAGLTDCGGTCINLQSDNNNCGSCGTNCPAGYECISGSCTLTCQAGLTDCGGTCTNLQTDNSSCGTCGNNCPAGYECISGSCTLTCQAGLTDCGGTCANLQSDNTNCGACGTICPSGQCCVNGVCM
jgi:hypothetical protein